jgi:class 3 adenylate cyclase
MIWHHNRASAVRRAVDLAQRRSACQPWRVQRPNTLYAWNAGVAIAYQVVGSEGPDLLFAPGSVTHLDVLWEEPRVRRFLSRLASFSRLVIMDPRGLGLSDRVDAPPTLDERVGDILAVLDAAGCDRATLLGTADTGPACIAAAAQHPERVERLILHGTFAKGSRSDDYPIGWDDADAADFQQFVHDEWATPARLEVIAPSAVGDEAFQQWLMTLNRLGASPRAAITLDEMTRRVDVRPMLERVTAPTLVLHRTGDRLNPVEHGRYLADHIAGSQYVELPGDDFIFWAGDTSAIADEIEEFLTGRRGGAEPSRVLATVVFTDVVGSTQQAARLGDRAWTDLLETHHARVREQLRRFGGREVDTAGDGFFVAFDLPAVAIRWASAVVASVREIGVTVRIGMHTGECEVVGNGLRGMAVHIGARVSAAAAPGEVLVSQTVKDLVVGSGIAFDDRGEHQLKGVEGSWRLYAVRGV